MGRGSARQDGNALTDSGGLFTSSILAIYMRNLSRMRASIYYMKAVLIQPCFVFRFSQLFEGSRNCIDEDFGRKSPARCRI